MAGQKFQHTPNDPRLAALVAEFDSKADGKAVVTPTEAADILAVSTQTIRRMIWRGTLPASRFGGRRGPLRIRVSDLARAMRDAERNAVALVPAAIDRRARRAAEAMGGVR